MDYDSVDGSRPGDPLPPGTRSPDSTFDFRRIPSALSLRALAISISS